MDEAGVDTLLVTHLTNIRYLTGFTGSAGLLLVRPNDLLFVTDGRYADQAPAQLTAAGVSAEIEISGPGQREVLAAAVADGSRLGLEADHVTWSQFRSFDDDWFASAELVATTELVERLRVSKDGGELDRMRAAAAIADAALAQVQTMLAERPTERAFGLALDTMIRELGASGNSFETIVASGPNSALPHARPTDRTIVEGDLVILDFGAVVEGYCSDMTRTMVVGEPDEFAAELWSLVAQSQQAGVDAVRAGVDAKVVDSACRDIIEAAGHGEKFSHGTGHGVGLDIHEAPRVAATSTATLAAGHVVTVEPGVYLAPHGGVRIEDTVVVTERGCEPLTHTPKLISVG